MLHNDLLELKELNNGDEVYKLPDAYDDFAIGVVMINNVFYVVYDPTAIIDDLVENAGVNEQEAEKSFAETIGGDSQVAWLVKELNSEDEEDCYLEE